MDGEREREIKSSDSNLSVSAFEHISLCKFCPLRRLPCLLSNKIPKILWILLEYSYPPFIYPSIQGNNSETEEKKEGEIKTSRATIATGAIIRLLLTQGGGEWGADRQTVTSSSLLFIYKFSSPSSRIDVRAEGGRQTRRARDAPIAITQIRLNFPGRKFCGPLGSSKGAATGPPRSTFINPQLYRRLLRRPRELCRANSFGEGECVRVKCTCKFLKVKNRLERILRSKQIFRSCSFKRFFIAEFSNILPSSKN